MNAVLICCALACGRVFRVECAQMVWGQGDIIGWIGVVLEWKMMLLKVPVRNTVQYLSLVNMIEGLQVFCGFGREEGHPWAWWA